MCVRFVVVVLGLLPILCVADGRGASRQPETRQDGVIAIPDIYSASYALLIGVSDYRHWPDLPSIVSELDMLDDELTRHGFGVERLSNPDLNQLTRGVEQFIRRYGYSANNRLLIFFSGHGHSVRDRGYLVPANAPLPSGQQSFGPSALPMEQVMSWARVIESKHVLFAFDSCFSGSIFKTRSLPTENSPYISQIAEQPVRQFLTSGSADEEVPAKSTFAPMFVGGISGKGDLNGDGYVTGSELGLYITQELPRYVAMQTPQYGKINDYQLSQGDFVFGPVDSNIARPDITLGATPAKPLPVRDSPIRPVPVPAPTVSPMAVLEKMGVVAKHTATLNNYDFYKIEELNDRRNTLLKPNYVLRMSKTTDWSSPKVRIEYAKDQRATFRSMDCVLKLQRYFDCD